MNQADPHPRRAPERRPAFGKKRFWLPAAHGSWTWWIGPLLIGLAAGGHPRWNFTSLVISALAGFLLMQPATIAAKVLSGRRPRSDLRPALQWMAIYTFFCLLGVTCIVQAGDVHVLGLAAPGLLVFAAYLWLVFRHAERRQMAMEVLASGVMALAAPAAYWAAGGEDYPEPWVLWALTWLQSAAAIANVYLRLDQRRWSGRRSGKERLAAGWRTLVVHGAGPGGRRALRRRGPRAPARDRRLRRRARRRPGHRVATDARRPPRADRHAPARRHGGLRRDPGDRLPDLAATTSRNRGARRDGR